MLKPSGKLLGIVSGEIPQVLQNQCFAVLVLKVYSVRCSFPSRDFRASARMTRPRKPGGGLVSGIMLRGKGESGWSGREGNTGAGTFHVADAAITFAEGEIRGVQD